MVNDDVVAGVTVSHEEIPFQGKDPGEIFQFYFRQHWIRLLPSFLRMIGGFIFVLIIGFIFFYEIDLDDPFLTRFILLLLTIFFLFTQFEFMLKFYRYFLYVTVVTDKKVHRIKKTLIAIDEHESIDLWVLQDINKRQRGIIQNILGFGTLMLNAQDSEMRIHFTPSIDEKYKQIMFLRENARSTLMGGQQNPMGQMVEQKSS